jgi:hypothetical protein
LKSSRPEGAQEEHRARAPTTIGSHSEILTAIGSGEATQRLRVGARAQEAQEGQSQPLNRPIESGPLVFKAKKQSEESAQGEQI